MIKQFQTWAKVGLCSILTLSLTTASVYASPFATGNDLDYNVRNGILYYDASGINNCVIGVGSYNGTTSAGLSSTQAGFVDAYHDIAAQLSVEYGIPWETVMAQGILESAAGTSHFATERNNFFGIGAFDSNPDNAFRYDTPEAGWKGYFENIRKTATYRNHGVFQGDTITDPYAYLVAIKSAGYATDPNYINKVSQFIAAIENRSKEQGWASSAELAATYSEMYENAARYASGEPVVDTYQSYGNSTCLVQNGVDITDYETGTIISSGNGSINETALSLAWIGGNRQHDKTDPKPAYTAALKATGLSTYGEKWVQIGASCDAFVAAVMRYSGLDPNFYCCGVQYNRLGKDDQGIHKYLVTHPEKYQYVGPGDNSTLAQPGDIRISNGHIELVVQLDDGKLAIASASHADRTAEVSNGWFAESSKRGTYKLYRFIGNNSTNKDNITSY